MQIAQVLWHEVFVHVENSAYFINEILNLKEKRVSNKELDLKIRKFYLEE
jgi:hypothetical protein